MRKYGSFVAILTLCLFAAFAMAQTPGGTTGTNDTSSSSASATPNPQNSSQPVTGSSTDPYSVKSGPNGRAADSAASDQGSAGTEKTLDGCIVKEQTDYFIQPESGDRQRLTGSQDLSSHVGHHVKVHGSEAANSPSSSANSNSPERSSTSGTASTETQNNAAGSIAGNAGSSNATGTGSSNANSTSKDFAVSRVDMISESCPANIQSKIDQNKAH